MKKFLILSLLVLVSGFYASDAFAQTTVIDLDSSNWNDKIWPSTVTVDNAGNIYIAAVQFPDPYNPEAPYNDPVTKIQKYDSSGNLLLTFPNTYEKIFSHGAASNSGDIAVDSSGNLYVLPHGDGSPWRIQKFSSSGSDMGTFTLLSFSPYSLVIDNSDKIYASGYGDNFGTDTDYHIEVFDLSGNTLQTVNTGSNRGTLAIDDLGNMWLFDNTNIHKYDSSGNLLFSKTTTIDNRLSQYAGLAVNSNGEVFAPNNDNSKVNVYDSSGNFIQSFGSPGTGVGEFAAWNPSGGLHVSGPLDVDIGNDGKIYVAGYGGHRVQIFPADYLDNTSNDSTPPSVVTSVDLAVFGNGPTTVTYSSPTATDNIGVVSGPTCDHPSGSSFSQGITTVTCTATDAAGNVGESTFQVKVDSGVLDSSDISFVETITGASNWGYTDYTSPKFQFPSGISYKDPENVDSDGNSYVVLNSNNAGSGYNYVQKLSSSGNLIFELGSAGIGYDIGYFYNPEDVVVDSHDNFYVADRSNSRVQVFDSEGFYLFSITSGGHSFGSDLYNLAIDNDDNLYVADNLNNKVIHVFSNSFGYVPPVIHPSSPCDDGCTHEGNNPDLKIFASGYIENPRDGITTISSVWEDPEGVVVYNKVLQVNSQGQFNNEFDNPMYVRDMRDSGLYTTTYTYDDIVLEYTWNYLSSVYEPDDTIPPVVVVPNNMAIEATSNNPSPVTFSVSASDDKDGPITPACTHASGSNFPIGTTAVTCTAIDTAGNQSSESFTITVTFEQVSDGNVLSLNLGQDSYNINESFTFFGTQTGNDVVYVIIRDSDGTFLGMLSDPEPTPGEFSVIPRPVENFVGSSGYYTATAFTDSETEEEGIILQLNFDGVELDTDLSSNYEPEPEPEPEQQIISITTNKFSYSSGETIFLNGKIQNYEDAGHALTFTINSPDDNIVQIGQISEGVNSDGSFEGTFYPGSALWKQSGSYTITIFYGPIQGHATVNYVGGNTTPAPEPSPEPEPEPEPEISEVVIHPVSGSGAPGCEEQGGCYVPNPARVSAGGVVIMENTDTAAHTFTSGRPDSGPDGIFDTGLIMAGQSFDWIPEEDGNYPYFCMVHPWMLGEIIVGEGGDTPTPIRLSVKTDKSFYHIGDDLEIKGVVKPYEGSNVILQIYGPSGNLVYDERIRPSSSGAFTDELKLAGSDYRNTGTYIVKSIYKSQSHELQFTLQKETPYDIPKTDLRTQDEVTIVPVDGSGAPGCEDTSTGCYIPSVVSVSVGGTVIMKNTDTAAHTFTSGTPEEGPTGIFDTSLLMAGGSFEWSPRTEGEVPYFCMVHPWMVGTILVGEGTTRMHPVPNPVDNVDLDISVEQRVYDINSVVLMKIELSGTDDAKGVAIDVTDPRGTTVVSRSITVDPDQVAEFEFKIDESPKTGNYKVTATASHSDRILKDTAHFKVKSQFNSFKIEAVEITDQKGNPSDLEAGEIGFIKVNLSSNKSIATLLTVNIFDSELTSIGIGSVQTTLSSGGSEIILSFNIPDDASSGPAEIYVNAFTDWPSEGGIPLTGEVSTTEEIE